MAPSLQRVLAPDLFLATPLQRGAPPVQRGVSYHDRAHSFIRIGPRTSTPKPS